MSENSPGAPRPRVLAFGLTANEVEAVRPYAGSLTIYSEGDTPPHPEEHDVLILTGTEFHTAAFSIPRRIAFAPSAEPASARPRVASASGFDGGFGPPPNTKTQTQFSPARDFDVTAFAMEHGLAPLVRRSCLPKPHTTYTGVRLPVWPKRLTHAFAQERLSRPLTLAALFESEQDSGQPDSVFWLPDIARTFIAEWVASAFAYWRASEADVFPITADWKRAFSSPPETRARDALIAFDHSESERQQQVSEQRARLNSELENAEKDGESWRALLSQTGDDLVAAIKDALELIGFNVTDSDALPQHKGKKREDLRVTDGNWVALAEVKGYTGAAKSNDLLQLTSASSAYAAANRRTPDALWYMPNIYRDVDPAQRESALAGREDDLTSFGEEHHGCLIDTRELFHLRQRFATKEISAEQARETLKNAVGRYRDGKP